MPNQEPASASILGNSSVRVGGHFGFLWRLPLTTRSQTSVSCFPLPPPHSPFYISNIHFNCLFPLDVRNEIQLLSEVFCYSRLVGFWLRNTSLVKVGNPISDGIVFVFHLAWCIRGLKSLKRFWPYLIVFRASRMVSLSNYCIWCLFFISNLMKSGVVYAAI